MKDITNSVLARKDAAKIKNPLFTTKKFITSLAIALGIAGIGLGSLASATNPVTWGGNGVTSGSLNTVQCDENNTPYLLWVFTGNGATAANITIVSNHVTVVAGASMDQQGGGAYQYTSDFYPLDTLSASVTYTGTVTGNPNLVISHGCPGGTSTTATTLKDASDNTVAEGASVPLGSVIHDTATVTLTPSAVPTGSVSFRFYATAADCTADTDFTGGTTMGTVALDGANPGVADPSTATSALAPGTYAFKAMWPGMTGYTGSTSSCETFTVNQAQLSVTTNIHDSDHNVITTASLGNVVHDTATLSGAVSRFSPPAITFTFYTNGTCDGTGTPVDNTGADEVTTTADRSADSSALTPGSYSYKASVAGDTNYLGDNSDCEPLTVNKATLGLSTDIHDATHNIVTAVNAGDTVHDQANVSGIVSGFAPANNVTFTFYTDGDCTTGISHAAGSVAIVNGVAHPSDSEGPLNAGSYAFQASYDGSTDSNYNSITSDCEPLTVNKVTPNITTTPNPSTAVLGATLNDSATVSGGYNPTGSATFNLYPPADTSCLGTPAYTYTDTTSPYATTPGFASNAAGTWRWTATYNGDTNNNAVTSGCQDEQVTVTQVLYWCSPGFWATALKQQRNGVLSYLYDKTNPHLVLTNVHYNDINGASLSKKAKNTNPTLADVLLNPNTYGGPAFNSVADYIAAQLGWNGTQLTGENCPLDAHGTFTDTLSVTTL